MKEFKKEDYYVIRGDRSGVFFGNILEKEGTEVRIGNCRRLWYWEGACSLSEVAQIGTAKPDKCKFTVTVEELIITDCIELIKCTEEAVEIIKGVEEWKSQK